MLDRSLEPLRLRTFVLHEIACGADFRVAGRVWRRGRIDSGSSNVIRPAFSAFHVVARAVDVFLIRYATLAAHQVLLWRAPVLGFGNGIVGGSGAVGCGTGCGQGFGGFGMSPANKIDVVVIR